MKIGLRRCKTKGPATIGLEFLDETGNIIGQVPIKEMELPGPGAIGSLKTEIIKIHTQFNDVASIIVTLSESTEDIDITLSPDKNEPWNIAWDKTVPANVGTTPKELSYSVYDEGKDVIE